MTQPRSSKMSDVRASMQLQGKRDPMLDDLNIGSEEKEKAEKRTTAKKTKIKKETKQTKQASRKRDTSKKSEKPAIVSSKKKTAKQRDTLLRNSVTNEENTNLQLDAEPVDNSDEQEEFWEYMRDRSIVAEKKQTITGKKRRLPTTPKKTAKKPKLKHISEEGSFSSSSSASDIRDYLSRSVAAATTGTTAKNTEFANNKPNRQDTDDDYRSRSGADDDDDHDSFFDDSGDAMERKRLAEIMTSINQKYLERSGESSLDGSGNLGIPSHSTNTGNCGINIALPRSTSCGDRSNGGNRKSIHDNQKSRQNNAAPAPSWQPTISPMLERIRRELGEPPEGQGCFACSHAPAEEVPTCWESWSDLKKMVTDGIMRRDPVELAKSAHDFFIEKIRNPANKSISKGGIPVPDWHPYTIFEHFMVHMQEPSFNQWRRIRQVGDLADSVYNHHLWETHTETGETRANLGALKLYAEILKIEQILYKQDPSKMFAASKQFHLEITSPFVNPHKPLYARNPAHLLTAKITTESLTSS